MAINSIGLVELSSIASGFQACDAMLKASYVELVLARSICSGKYIVLVKGDVAAVEASVESGCRAGDLAIVDSMVIPNLHESVFPALAGINKAETLEALRRWADDDLRSVNAQVEFLLRRALLDAGRLPKPTTA